MCFFNMFFFSIINCTKRGIICFLKNEIMQIHIDYSPTYFCTGLSAVMDKELTLTEDIQKILEKQNTRLISDHEACEVERNNKKYWDLFYKRNETRFFKDRNWTVNEFHEFVNEDNTGVLLEVGCGVGNFIFPLLSWSKIQYIHACDISPRAIEFVKQNPLYDSSKINAFSCDITEDTILSDVSAESIDITTLIFVLSAIHPHKFDTVVKNLFALVKPGGIVLFRDYGLYDMVQLRFKPGRKISDNLYLRQDKTR